MWNAIVFATSVATVLAIQGSASPVAMRESPVAMRDLTPPKDRLPESCSLTNDVTLAALWPTLQIKTNPWTGTDRRILASIRERLDPQPPLRDAPLIPKSEAARRFLQLGDDVDEGYAAVYRESESNDLVVVYGLMFAPTAKPSHSSGYIPTDSRRMRIEIGNLVVMVLGTDGSCFRALKVYLNALGH